MNDTCATRDLAKKPGTMWLLWGLPTAIILLSGYVARSAWIVTISWTVSLAVMGGACVVNARGCGRMHCYFTGPFFLIMAVASLAYGLHWLPLGPHGWNYVGAILLAGAVLLCFVPEWLWGRYRSTRTDSRGQEC